MAGPRMMDTLELPDETKPAIRPQREETPKLSEPTLATAADRSASASWRLGTLLVFAVALVALVPTTGDIGMTWDEPAYRYSQVMSAQWWDQLAHARSWAELRGLFDAESLLYYWPYARFGINFHPPLAGQLNLATHALFDSWMKDIPARRMASVIEFALTIAIGFGVLLGLAFVEKMAAVGVLLPLLLWLVVAHLPRSLAGRGARANWIDGLCTSGLILLPLLLSFQEIQGLQ